MIQRLKSVFERFLATRPICTKHGPHVCRPNGEVLGNIDSYGLVGGRVFVSGWALSDSVTVYTGDSSIEVRPSQERLDVVSQYPSAAGTWPGYRADLPYFGGPVWVNLGLEGEGLILQLPPIGTNQIRVARAARLPEFLFRVLTAIPAYLRWRGTKDPSDMAQLKVRLGVSDAETSAMISPAILEARVKISLDVARATIILPIYNAFELLPEMLERVLENTDSAYDLIVVEDGSTDERVRPWLRAWVNEFPGDEARRVQLIENPENLGFIRSVNKGFEAALRQDGPVILLNSDAFVPKGWLRRLIAPLSDPKVASVTPMSNDAEIFSVPVIVKRIDIEPDAVDLIDRAAQELTSPGLSAIAPTGVGFCMALQRNFLTTNSEFDTAFGRGYGEEVDWCQKAVRQGGRHVALPTLFVEHRGGQSFGSDEKRRLIAKNNAEIARRYPSYDREVQDFILSDPLLTARLCLGMAWAGSCRDEVPVYLAHSLGGGAENYLKDRIKNEAEADLPSVVIRVGGPTVWSIELHTKDGQTTGRCNDFDLVEAVLKHLPKRRIIYSCGVGAPEAAELPKRLSELVRNQKDTAELLVHDYFMVSPEYTLLNSDKVFVGVPELNDPDPVHNNGRALDGVISLSEWRAAWSGFVELTDRITVFSEDSSHHIGAAFPKAAKKIQVVPHRLAYPIPKIEPGGKGRVIAAFGNIGAQKGAGVISDLSRLIDKSRGEKLMVLGNFDPAYPLSGDVCVHGDYRVPDLPDLVRKYGITDWIVPSIWPETFSYTTHEALATGMPVYVFDLGAQADAARKAKNGYVLPYNSGARLAETFLDAIKDTSGENQKEEYEIEL